MTETLFGATVPSLVNEADGIPYALGTRFTTNASGTITHGRWYFPTTIPDPSVQVQIGLFSVASPGTPLATATFPLGSTLGAWNQVAFGTPVAITTGITYEISVWTPLRYVATSGFGYPISGTNLTAPSPNGYFTANTPVLVMAATNSGASYFADVVFEPGGGASPTGLAIPITFGTPAVSLNRTAAPTGLSIPITFGSPAAGITVQPSGLAIPITFGTPRAGPTVLTASQGSWWVLAAIMDENRAYAREARTQEPVACPNDGEPLQLDPDGRLRCRYDGWVWRGYGQV